MHTTIQPDVGITSISNWMQAYPETVPNDVRNKTHMLLQLTYGPLTTLPLLTSSIEDSLIGDQKTSRQKILLLWRMKLVTDTTQIDNGNFVVIDPDVYLVLEGGDERIEGFVLYLHESYRSVGVGKGFVGFRGDEGRSKSVEEEI
jgi:hypothetical protein